jgi:osmotically-inducible protein OsmY
LQLSLYYKIFAAEEARVFHFFNKSDASLKRDVLSELSWDVSLNSEQIHVSCEEGIVTLSGSVPHYNEKRLAERAAQRVGAVKAVADELEVKSLSQKTDVDIARVALKSLEWNSALLSEIKISVEKGWVHLSGEVEWEYQRAKAVETVSAILGVCGVTSSMTIRTKSQPSDIKKLIQTALSRTSAAECKNIEIEVNGDKVTLSGQVRSFAQSEDVRMAAWSAPGVCMVVNNLELSHS